MHGSADAAGASRFGGLSTVQLTAIAALIVVSVAGVQLLNAWLDPIATLHAGVERAGSSGPLVFIGLFLLLNTLGVPLPVLGAAAGAAFGPVSGAIASLAAMMITACAQFLLARYVIGGWVGQRLGHALTRVNRLLQRRGVLAVAAARIVPGPFSEFNMLAGLTFLTLRDFTIGTLIGCAPKALAWSGLGALLF